MSSTDSSVNQDAGSETEPPTAKLLFTSGRKLALVKEPRLATLEEPKLELVAAPKILSGSAAEARSACPATIKPRLENIIGSSCALTLSDFFYIGSKTLFAQ